MVNHGQSISIIRLWEMFYQADASLQLQLRAFFFCFICNSIDCEEWSYAITILEKNLIWYPSLLNISRHVPNHSPRINTTATPRSARISAGVEFLIHGSARDSFSCRWVSCRPLSHSSLTLFRLQHRNARHFPFCSSSLSTSVKTCTCNLSGRQDW